MQFWILQYCDKKDVMKLTWTFKKFADFSKSNNLHMVL